MGERPVLILTTRDVLPNAKDLASLLNCEGWSATVAVGEDGIPIESTLPIAVIIWAHPLSAYSLFKAAKSCFSRSLTQFLMVLPSLEPVKSEVDPVYSNEVYVTGRVSTRDIANSLKEHLDGKRRAAPARPMPPKPPEPTRQARIITVFSAKGGVGKTAISTNVAVAIKEISQKDVLLIDGDLQFGDIAVWLGLSPRTGMTELLTRGAQADELAIKGTVQEHESGLHVLLPPSHPATAERIRPEAVKTLISILRGMYDYMVIDTHTSYGDETLAMLDVADDIIVVVTPEINVVRNTQIFLELCEILGYSDKLTVVLNRANTGIQRNQLPECIRRLVKAEVVSDGRAVVWSLNAGKPFVQTDKSLPVAKGIQSLATLLAGLSASDAKGGPRRTWWPFAIGATKRNGASVAASRR